MKKLILILNVLLFTSVSFAQITVPEVQQSLYGAVDATWCGICGNVGVPTTASIYSQVSDKAVFFEMHRSQSSALHSNVATTLATAFGASAQPQVTLNGMFLGILNANIENQIVSDVNANYNATSTDINAGFEWWIENDTLYVTTNTKYFTDLAGEFYTGVYVTEDSIWEFQANYNPNIPDGNIYHFHILRDVLSSNAFGIETGNGMMTSGQEFEETHKIKINADWDLDNIHINTVVWQKNGATYSFLNANNVGIKKQTTTSISEMTTAMSIQIFPNPASESIFIRLNESTNGTIQIFDQLGAIVSEVSINSAFSEIDVSNLKAGMYFVGGTTSNAVIKNKRFIKK